jgi:hypothetical protein
VRIIGGIDRVGDLIRNRPQSRLRGFCVDPLLRSVRNASEGPSRKRSKDSQIEVVAFDSTLIEVTTDIEDILENLRCRFGATLVVE